MIVLVTGGNGFLGSHIVEELLRRGYGVRCLVRRKSNLRWLKGLPVEFFYWDEDELSDRDLWHAFDGVDYVANAAGVVASKTRKGFFEGNQMATRRLLAATKIMAPKIKRFLQVSSFAAVGPASDPDPINEWAPPIPLTAYGQSKYEAEREVEWASRDLPTTIVRPPAIYGPRDTATLPFFKAVLRGIVPLVGSKPKFVSLVHVSDVARGIVQAMEAENAVNQTYFIGSEEGYSWDEIADIAAKCVGKNVKKVRIPEMVVLGIAAFSGFLSLFSRKPSVLNLDKGKEMIQWNWVCNISRAKRDFNYCPRISLEEGFRTTIEWYKTMGWL